MKSSSVCITMCYINRDTSSVVVLIYSNYFLFFFWLYNILILWSIHFHFYFSNCQFKRHISQLLAGAGRTQWTRLTNSCVHYARWKWISMKNDIYHDDHRFGSDFFRTCRVPQRANRFTCVRSDRWYARYLSNKTYRKFHVFDKICFL